MDTPANPAGMASGANAASSAAAEEMALVMALRQGDETAFVMLVNMYQLSLLRLAKSYVHDPAVAEEVVQETWVGVLRGLANFEGRSSLKTWLFRILVNTAKTRAVREGRSVPFSALSLSEEDNDETTLAPERFLPPDHQWAGHWAIAPQSWAAVPEDRLLAHETTAHIQAAIAELPPNQQVVITLRDIEGWEAGEVCQFLGITEANQRVLLHRARGKVRRALEQYFTETAA